MTRKRDGELVDHRRLDAVVEGHDVQVALAALVDSLVETVGDESQSVGAAALLRGAR